MESPEGGVVPVAPDTTGSLSSPAPPRLRCPAQLLTPSLFLCCSLSLFLLSCSITLVLNYSGPLFLLNCSGLLFLSCSSPLFLCSRYPLSPSCSSHWSLLSCSSPLFLRCSSHWSLLSCSSPLFLWLLPLTFLSSSSDLHYVTGCQSQRSSGCLRRPTHVEEADRRETPGPPLTHRIQTRYRSPDIDQLSLQVRSGWVVFLHGGGREGGGLVDEEGRGSVFWVDQIRHVSSMGNLIKVLTRDIDNNGGNFFLDFEILTLSTVWSMNAGGACSSGPGDEDRV
eukprot:superscaffoldBa00009298_g24002